MTRVSRLLVSIFFLFIIALWSTFIGVEPNEGFDITSVLLMTAVVVELSLLLLITDEVTKPMMLVFTASTFMFFCPRLIALMLWPEFYKFIESELHRLYAYSLNKAIFFLAAGIPVVGIGMIMGSKFLPSSRLAFRYEESCSPKLSHGNWKMALSRRALSSQ